MKRKFANNDEMVKYIESLQIMSQEVLSLDAKVGNSTEDPDTELADFIQDSAPGPEELTITKDLINYMSDVMQKYLSPREQAVITARYGLKNGRSMSLEEVGKIYKVTRERIRQVEEKALRKLRNKLSRGDFYGDGTET